MSSLVTWTDIPCPAATDFCSFSVCVGEAMIESGYLPLAAIVTPVDHKTDIDLSRFCQPITHHPQCITESHPTIRELIYFIVILWLRRNAIYSAVSESKEQSGRSRKFHWNTEINSISVLAVVFIALVLKYFLSNTGCNKPLSLNSSKSTTLLTLR
jgi:hypothetical protein